jgi:hypothetical protein
MATDPRTVYLQAAPLPNAAELRWPDKSPGATVPCTFNAAGWLCAGDSINAASITITSQPAGLTFTLVAASVSGTSFQYLIGSGALPETGNVTDYACTVGFTTPLGAVCSEVVWIRITPQSPNASYPGLALSVVQGSPGLSVGAVSVDPATGNVAFALSDNTPLGEVNLNGALAKSTILQQIESLEPGDLVVLLRNDTMVCISAASFLGSVEATSSFDFSNASNAVNFVVGF